MVERNDHTVSVRRQWNDWRDAEYRLSDISGLHWSRISGGAFAPAPQPFIHGYVLCAQMLGGELAHSCSHGSGPHEIKVCIVKKMNKPAVFKQLQQIAGPKPK